MTDSKVLAWERLRITVIEEESGVYYCLFKIPPNSLYQQYAIDE